MSRKPLHLRPTWGLTKWWWDSLSMCLFEVMIKKSDPVSQGWATLSLEAGHSVLCLAMREQQKWVVALAGEEPDSRETWNSQRNPILVMA